MIHKESGKIMKLTKDLHYIIQLVDGEIIKGAYQGESNGFLLFHRTSSVVPPAVCPLKKSSIAKVTLDTKVASKNALQAKHCLANGHMIKPIESKASRLNGTSDLPVIPKT